MSSNQLHADHRTLDELPFLSKNSLDRSLMDELTRMISTQIALYSSAQRPQIAESLGLTLPDYSALELIMGFRELSTGQIARLTGLSSGGTTTLLNRLESAGYVRRERHPLDRRIITVRPIAENCQSVLALSQKNVKDALNITVCQHTIHIRPAYELLKRCLENMQSQTCDWLDTGHDIQLHTQSP